MKRIKPNPGSDDAEEWKQIPNFEGRYSVSNTGKVKSHNYFGNPNASGILKPRWTQLSRKNKCRYASVRLIDKSKKLDAQFRIHRLVATCFIPNPQNKKEVNHIDGNGENNNVENLEWVSSSENHRHAFENGFMSTRAAHAARTENATKFSWLHDNKGEFLGTPVQLVQQDIDMPKTAVSLAYKVTLPHLKHYKHCFGWRVAWTPGSDGAINKFSCECPRLDNNHGKGRGDGLFYISADCPLHKSTRYAAPKRPK